MKKRLFSWLLVFVMLLGMFPVGVMATGTDNEEYVYLSISFDGQYIDDKKGDPIVYLPVSLDTIAAVDLTEYGLANMLFDGNGDGNYDITALQLLIYAHEELYGGSWSDVNFDAIPGSSYFAGGIFGFTENLVYFHNGDFPVDESQTSDYMTAGATSDRIVLKDGDFLDVASFSCYQFLWDQQGGFHLFADQDGNYVHDYTAEVGESLSVKVKHSFCDLMYGQSWVKDATDYEVYYGSVLGEAENSVTTDGSGNAEITFQNAGTYYVWCDGDIGFDDGWTHTSCDYYNENGTPCIVSAPAYAKVTVAGDNNGSEEPEPPATYTVTWKNGDDILETDEDVAVGATPEYSGAEPVKAADTQYTYTFTGWDKEIVAVSEDVTYTAIFTPAPRTYVITLNTNEGSVNSGNVESYTFGIGTTLPSDVTREGYTFGGWYTNAEFSGEAVTAIVTDATGDKTFYAKWIQNQPTPDEATASAVEEKITAIGDVTLEKESVIAAARAAYDALTDTQKALVENYAVLTAAETALAELKAAAARQPQDISAVLNATLANLATTVTEPSFGTNHGEWTVFSLARGNHFAKDSKYFADYYTRILYNVDTAAKAVNQNGALDANKSTDNSRLIFALSSIGIDATSVGNWDLVEAYSANGMNWIQKQGINGTIWALIALDSGNYTTTDTDPTIRQECVDAILAAQHDDGGWSLITDKTLTSNVDITGMALTALYPYRDKTEVAAACEEAFAWLSESQLTNGGFPYGEGETSESCVWAIVACTTWGINPDTDPRFVKNGNSAIDNLLTYYLEETAQFEHIRGAGYNAMATDQASYALVAYDRLLKGKNDLFDMSDVVITESEQQLKAVESISFDSGKLSVMVGETVDLTAIVTPAETVYGTVTWTSTSNDVAKINTSNKNMAKIKGVSVGTATITVSIGDKSASCEVTVTKDENTPQKPVKKTITVAMRLIGAELAEQDVDLSKAEYLPDYVTWIPTTRYTLEEGATVYDLWVEATETADIRSVGASRNYVETVCAPDELGGYELSEFTNGYRSGWMYTINGSHPGFGLLEQELSDGDVVIWHYVNDYAWEVEDWSAIGGSGWAQESTSENNYWNRWLKAPNRFGGTGGGLGDPESKFPKKEENKGDITISVSGNTDAIEVSATVEGTKVIIEKMELGNLDALMGSGSSTGAVTIDFSGLDNDEPITTVELPAEAIKQIAEAVNNPSNDANSLEIVLSDGASIEFDAAALKEKTSQANAQDITISIENRENIKITNAQKKTVGTRPAFDINVTSGGKHISDMGGKITIHVPYELKAGEKAHGVVVWYVDDRGNKERCTTSYDSIKKRVSWQTDHLSLYMIGYDETLANNPFTDISMDNYFYDAVLWAVDAGITSGTSATTFSPNANCTRAQMVTFLWRAAGSPKAAATTCTFADVDKDAYYYEALLWAVENGITSGTSATAFSPDAACSRGQMAMFLYRNAESPAVTGDNSFNDVSDTAYYRDAVNWAKAEGITAGTSATTFSPDAACTRAQMVTFLYRYLAE